MRRVWLVTIVAMTLSLWIQLVHCSSGSNGGTSSEGLLRGSRPALGRVALEDVARFQGAKQVAGNADALTRRMLFPRRIQLSAEDAAAKCFEILQRLGRRNGGIGNRRSVSGGTETMDSYYNDADHTETLIREFQSLMFYGLPYEYVGQRNLERAMRFTRSYHPSTHFTFAQQVIGYLPTLNLDADINVIDEPDQPLVNVLGQRWTEYHLLGLVFLYRVLPESALSVLLFDGCLDFAEQTTDTNGQELTQCINDSDGQQMLDREGSSSADDWDSRPLLDRKNSVLAPSSLCASLQQLNGATEARFPVRLLFRLAFSRVFQHLGDIQREFNLRAMILELIVGPSSRSIPRSNACSRYWLPSFYDLSEENGEQFIAEQMYRLGRFQHIFDLFIDGYEASYGGGEQWREEFVLKDEGIYADTQDYFGDQDLYRYWRFITGRAAGDNLSQKREGLTPLSISAKRMNRAMNWGRWFRGPREPEFFLDRLPTGAEDLFVPGNPTPSPTIGDPGTPPPVPPPTDDDDEDEFYDCYEIYQGSGTSVVVTRAANNPGSENPPTYTEYSSEGASDGEWANGEWASKIFFKVGREELPLSQEWIPTDDVKTCEFLAGGVYSMRTSMSSGGYRRLQVLPGPRDYDSETGLWFEHDEDPEPETPCYPVDLNDGAHLINNDAIRWSTELAAVVRVSRMSWHLLEQNPFSLASAYKMLFKSEPMYHGPGSTFVQTVWKGVKGAFRSIFHPHHRHKTKPVEERPQYEATEAISAEFRHLASPHSQAALVCDSLLTPLGAAAVHPDGAGTAYGKLECPEDTVIQIDSMFYGRADMVTCPNLNLDATDNIEFRMFEGQSADGVRIIVGSDEPNTFETRCNGENKCEWVPNWARYGADSQITQLCRRQGLNNCLWWQYGYAHITYSCHVPKQQVLDPSLGTHNALHCSEPGEVIEIENVEWEQTSRADLRNILALTCNGHEFCALDISHSEWQAERPTWPKSQSQKGKLEFKCVAAPVCYNRERDGRDVYGILDQSENACCAASCGECRQTDQCGSLPGGENACCPKNIIALANDDTNTMALCEAPDPDHFHPSGPCVMPQVGYVRASTNEKVHTGAVNSFEKLLCPTWQLGSNSLRICSEKMFFSPLPHCEFSAAPCKMSSPTPKRTIAFERPGTEDGAQQEPVYGQFDTFQRVVCPESCDQCNDNTMCNYGPATSWQRRDCCVSEILKQGRDCATHQAPCYNTWGGWGEEETGLG